MNSCLYFLLQHSTSVCHMQTCLYTYTYGIIVEDCAYLTCVIHWHTMTHKPTSINEPLHCFNAHTQSKQMVKVLCAFIFYLSGAVAWNLCCGWDSDLRVTEVCSVQPVFVIHILRGCAGRGNLAKSRRELSEHRKTSQHAPTLITPQIWHPQPLSPMHGFSFVTKYGKKKSKLLMVVFNAFLTFLFSLYAICYINLPQSVLNEDKRGGSLSLIVLDHNTVVGIKCHMITQHCQELFTAALIHCQLHNQRWTSIDGRNSAESLS